MAGELKYYYDVLALSATASFTFFDSVGTKFVNNLNKAGEIDEKKRFDIHTLRFYIAGGNDIVTEFVSWLHGIISVIIGGETKLQLPAWMCPGGGGPVSTGLLATGLATFTLNGPPDPTKVLVLDPPVTIPESTSFKVMLDYAAAITTTSTPNMTMVLGGREY